MEGGLRFNTSGGGSMQIASTDAGLANFGELTAYPSPVNTSADTATYGASFVCASNVAPEVPRRKFADERCLLLLRPGCSTISG